MLPEPDIRREEDAMARADTPYRTGTGAMNLDSKGKVNSFRKKSQNRDTYNTFRRKSNGGMGG